MYPDITQMKSLIANLVKKKNKLTKPTTHFLIKHTSENTDKGRISKSEFSYLR